MLKDKPLTAATITYATNNELGFDYLRDNMKFDRADMVQRAPNYAIVDECDSILIDEARTPLIISGPAEASTEKYYEVNKIIPHLEREKHFIMEEKSRTASLTEEGNAKAEELLGIGNLYDPENLEIMHHIYQGLKAHHLYKLDVEYMIKDGEVVIVDEFHRTFDAGPAPGVMVFTKRSKPKKECKFVTKIRRLQRSRSKIISVCTINFRE